MKKLYLFLIALVMVSCVTDLSEERQLPNLDTYELYDVPIMYGKVSIVTDTKGDTLAITGIPMKMRIPITGAITKASSLNVIHTDSPEYEEYKNKGVFDEYSTICFEDTPNGDCDYNDLVFHVHQRHIYASDKLKVQFRITPIAMGNTIPISLHFETFGGKNYTIYEDCRKEMFKKEQGFINTVPSMEKIEFKEHPTQVYDLGSQDWVYTRINWYIIANNKKLYVAAYDHTREYSKYVGTHGKPYGLVIPDIWNYYYPIELISMSEAYPLFDKWLKGEVDTFKGGQDESLLYMK